MGLTDFFRINFPYGIKRNNKGQWFAYNREYMPLGWNSSQHKRTISDDQVYSEFPIYTTYKGITDEKLRQLAVEPNSIILDEEGKIKQVFFYNDKTNPKNSPEYWNIYFEKIKLLSSFETKD
jgi:hypothetical protein